MKVSLYLNDKNSVMCNTDSKNMHVAQILNTALALRMLITQLLNFTA